MSTKSDVIILTLASRTAGVVTRSELLQSGVSSSTISNRIGRGFLMRVWAGLYEVPEMTSESTPLFRAVKSTPGSAMAGESSGRIWRCPLQPPLPDDPYHLIAPRRGPRTEMPGVVVHRTRRPFIDDVRYPIPRLPTLSPARTVLDLAGLPHIGDQRLSHIVETLLVEAVLEPSEIADLFERPDLRGVRGARRLRTLVESLIDGDPVDQSMLERRFSRLLADHAISGFERQVQPPWYDGRRGIVDFAYPAVRLIVEVDGRRWHTNSQAMAEDRRRDRDAATHGWQVIRVTWTDVIHHAARTAEQVARAIEARRSDVGRRGAAGAA